MVHISLNNDFDKDKNRGEIGAIKNLSKMCNYFDKHKLSMHLPTKNDFGDMNTAEIFAWDEKKPTASNLSSDIVSKSKSLLESGDINAACYKKIEKTFN